MTTEIKPDETVRIEQPRERRHLSADQFMNYCGRGFAVLLILLFALAVLGALAFCVFEAWAWAFNG